MATQVQTTYFCDQCEKQIGRPFGPLCISFAVVPDLFEGNVSDIPNSPKHYCGWHCAAIHMARLAAQTAPGVMPDVPDVPVAPGPAAAAEIPPAWVEGPKPINALVAEALGWRVWEDMRPDRRGRWFQERDSTDEGKIEVMPVLDYIGKLRRDMAAQ